MAETNFRSFKEIFDNYKEYSEDGLKSASVMQALSAGGQFASQNAMISRLNQKGTPGLTPGHISLNGFDIRTGGKRGLDRSFNTMLKYGRESGQDIAPSMLSRYSDANQTIEEKQAAISAETRDKERLINFKTEEEAKKFNTQKKINEENVRLNLEDRKTGMNMASLNQFLTGVANISNMNMAEKSNMMSTEAGLKSLAFSEGLNRPLKQFPTANTQPTNMPPPIAFGSNKGFDVGKSIGLFNKTADAAQLQEEEDLRKARSHKGIF